MEYGWMRQWARDTLNESGHPVPELAEVMEEANTGDNWLDRIVNAAKTVLPKAISSANAALAQLSYSGSTGNFQSAEENITLTAKFQRIVDQAPEKLGSPLYKYIYLNTLSGFAVCQDAVFSSSIATMTEEIAVEQFLNNGFFYE